MGQFGHGVARHSFRALAVLTLVEQPSDKRGLNDDRSTDRENLPIVFLPCGRSAKIDDASRRQMPFADAPALHFPPVEFRRSRAQPGQLEPSQGLAAKNA